jgi:hypothetical protein
MGLRISKVTVAFAGIMLLATVAPASAPALELPLRLDTRLTLAEQFGYEPDYPLNVPSFDLFNRAVMRSRSASQHQTGAAILASPDGWKRVSLIRAIRREHPGFTKTINGGGFVSERIEFDARGRAYTLIEIRVRGGRYYNVLLYSADGCLTWRAVTLPFGGKRALFDGRDSGTAALEAYSGWNVGSRPPLVAVWRPMADRPGSWASRNDLYVLKPSWRGGRLVLPKPTLVSRRYVGPCYAAGGASFAASKGSASYLVWPELGRPGENGTPTYVATFDYRTRRITGRRMIALAKPRRDAHDAPGIVRDGGGYLHVLTGAHHAPFLYARSASPLDTRRWTTPEQVLEGGYVGTDGLLPGSARQTYLALACLPDDSLVIVYRQARRGVDEDFAGEFYDALCVQRRSPEGLWSGPERLVCCADRAGYAIYYHKLAVDRLGRLYLSLSYFSPVDYPPAQRSANRYHHRMILVSKDAGVGWDLATDADFSRGMAPVAE